MNDHLLEVIAFLLGVPALALSARLVLKPFIDGWLRARELKAGARAVGPELEAQAQRIGQLEGELSALREEVGRISAVETFYSQLQAPAGATRPVNPPGAS